MSSARSGGTLYSERIEVTKACAEEGVICTVAEDEEGPAIISLVCYLYRKIQRLAQRKG